MIPYGRQSLDEEDIEAVVQVLRGDFLTTGPTVKAFEDAFAAYVGADYAVAVSSATAALHLLMLAQDLKSGDRVLTSPNTFLASANAVAMVGARPDFCDTNRCGNIDVESLMDCWDENTKGVVVVDYAGQPPEVRRISEFVRSKGGFVVEDASHGVGTRFAIDGVEHRTGGHPWADATVFSFHPVKTMTTGEGGMVTTSDGILAERLRRLRHHGVERDASRWTQAESMDAGSWYYEMQELGFNYRITDLQCALGLAQLKKLDRFIARRQEIVAVYNKAFAGLRGVEVPLVEPWLKQDCANVSVSWHLYSPQIDFSEIGVGRNDLMLRLKKQGVGTQVLYLPVYLQPWYQEQYGYRKGKCPNAERYFERTLSLPLFVGMEDDAVSKIIEMVARF